MLPIQRKEYAPGDVIIDKYRLLQLLGEGGMGSVWVAENTALKANVALKLIRADVAEASANDRFLSEARLAARLQHPAIVRVFDFGKTQNDEPFIVMELLEGETLGQRLTRLHLTGALEIAFDVQTAKFVEHRSGLTLEDGCLTRQRRDALLRGLLRLGCLGRLHQF